MQRQAIVAGKFYPGSRQELEAQVKGFLSQEPGIEPKPALMAMVPHAGYMFSGQVAGNTLARMQLSDRVLLLGPNHTGQGAGFSLWNQGSWKIPGGEIPVDEKLAEQLLKTEPLLQADFGAHKFEHSLEVVLPFIDLINPKAQIVPICLAVPDLDKLNRLGKNMAKVIKEYEQPVSIIVSSDMSHFISQDQAKKMDNLAIQKILDLDPEGLFQTVSKNRISMCGVLPMTAALFCAKDLGAQKAELVQYSTSGDAIGDYSQVVGYAGMLVS